MSLDIKPIIMSRKLVTILLGFFILAAAFGPRLALANSEPVHGSCHETPKEMPTACAIHCLTTAINDNELDEISTPIFSLFVPVIFETNFSPITEKVFIPFFVEAKVFRDNYPHLTVVKKE
ncbi:MAG: hypothetical protein V1716_02220 [Candidatus Uhrbacteria bacterium]